MYKSDGYDHPSKDTEDARGYVQLAIGMRLAQGMELYDIGERLLELARESAASICNEISGETMMAESRRMIEYEIERARQILVPNQ